MKRQILHVRSWRGWWASACVAVAGRALVAQGPPPAPALPPPINQSDDPILKPFIWRSIGPANMGGRVDDIAVVESDPSHHLHRIRDRRHVEDHEQRHHVDADLRRRSRSRRSATSRSRRRIPTSSTSAQAKRTTGRARRSAPASTSPSTAARRSRTSASKDTQSIGRIVVHPKDPNIVVCRGARAPVRPEPGARPLQDDRRRQDLDEHEVHR